ncbi:nucleoside deaminase [Nakamurella aerolata]|uniref:Nucleoside deaminase n=1 Tax=Nakamurella aerolata TaxID=1656892 RepID=A0A849ACV0_9ACTN|nr:nucleoside deaminase [Nakamurella aerolata]NNG36998.1 nucleoside deaminase [Nakamurella aerolata]
MSDRVSDAVSDGEHLEYLRRAVALAEQGVASGVGGPFGAVVVRDGEVLGEGWNQVTADNDPTAHAEVVAIRRACAAIGDFQLTGAAVYSSCEPCPMCLGALYWSRPAAVFFAASRDDAAAAGFDDSLIYQQLSLPLAQRSLPIRQLALPGAGAPFARWTSDQERTRY